jgi:hypothetical protein
MVSYQQVRFILSTTLTRLWLRVVASSTAYPRRRVPLLRLYESGDGFSINQQHALPEPVGMALYKPDVLSNIAAG